MFLSDVSIKQPVFATMMMVALVVLGVLSYQRLAIDEYPDVTYPVVLVQTSYPGASPEVMERQVSRPLEEVLNTVQGLREVTSTSYESSSLVRVQFQLGTDIGEALQDVQANVARTRRQLPDDIEDPVIRRFDPNDRPIMSIALQSTDRPISELTTLADEAVSTRLESVNGVGGVQRSGGAARQIRVQLDPAAMRAYGVSPPQVIQALDRENQEVPAGRVRRGEVERLVRVTGRIVDPKAFADITVAVRNGSPVRLSDIGTVIDGTEEARSASFMGDAAGEAPAVSLDILKISGTNTVEVAERVRGVVDALRGELPSDVSVRIVRDDSRRIRESLESVQHELILGAVLCIIIIYFFLNSWRSTIITGLALPISIISAFFVMWAFDFTLNTMTLLALSLAIGLLVDDAIVVRENIVRHLEMGKSHQQAAKDGTDEIGLAVFATTLAVVAVFIPVAFMGGQIGQIFFQFGVTVAFAVLVSLFVSFTLDPMLSSVWPDPEVEHGGGGGQGAVGGERHDSLGGHPAAPTAHGPPLTARTRNPIRRVAFAFNDWFERVSDRYPNGLDWCLRHRAVVVGGAALSIVAALAIVPKLGFTWMPDFDGGEFNVNYRATPGARLEYTTERGQALAKFLRSQPGVAYTYLSVGGGFRGTPSNGQIFVKLRPKSERDRSQEEIQTAVRGQLRRFPGVQANITGTPTIFGGFRQPILVNVQGPEPSRLKLVAEQVLAVVRTVPGTAEPQSSEEGDVPQLDVRVDREQAWAAGLGVGTIAGTLQPLFTGQVATQWEDPQGYQHDVVVVYPDSVRTSQSDVENIVVVSDRVNPATGQPTIVPLTQVADVRAGVGPQQIERSTLERQVSISSGVLPGYSMGDVAAGVERAISAAGLPPGYRAVFRGDVQNLNESKGYVLSAILLAVVFIYLILASLFGSFLQPLAIMFALPLSFIGVALALLLTRGNLNVMTMIGIIMLLGLVTKNGILLVDMANQQRAAGLERHDALLRAARTRIRPIIMTTVAMIFGMVPLALALGAGAEQRAPMGRAVIGGLVTSTILTLFVVPVAYTLLDDLGAWLGARWRGKDAGLGAPVPTPAAGD
ncbi:MAG: RND efflux system, inner membrane transporter [uncultured Gemmatimonadaceae bacterium]|uniref:RND efflux system, inner membrane transporter n=1 Tax=uncultured Gemmatimonadaceae bacterium TaxID=246130 RepID=A0A6J4KIL3_9BACT|nr:MAG: RND efflux system, inner membrane transporter [uncultured Gemmatimonadaceae bacterium]